MSLFFILIIIPIALGFWAQSKIKGTYNKFSQVRSVNNITGSDAAAYVLRSAGIRDVEIVPCRGHLTDHYDPVHKRLALSKDNYFGNSLAALGVAAHEAGHAIQHATSYAPLGWRSAGSLAMARRQTASSAGDTSGFRLLGGSGSQRATAAVSSPKVS